MRIKTDIFPGKTVIRPTGRLDSGNYGELQRIIDDTDFSSSDIVFDFSGLEYISSAGLRVMLSARKKTAAGNMKIINMSDAVYEIFETTGFDSIIDIQRRTDCADMEDLVRLSIKDLLRELVRKSPDRVFLTHLGRSYTWLEIDRCSQIIAADLARQGVKRGTHVGLCGANSVNWALTFFAIQKLGAIVCLLNPNYTPAEMKLISKVGDITHLCFGEIKQMNDDPGYLEKTVGQPDSMIKATYDIRNSLDFRERLGEYESVANEKWADVSSDDVCMMIYTSGSTGTPKGVLLSAYNLLNSSAIRAEVIRICPADRVCLILPLFHTFGLSAGFFCNALYGGSVAIPERISTGSILDTIEKEKCTLFHSVPTMILALMGNREFSSERVSTLRCINLGGAPVSRAQIMKMSSAFPHVRFLVNYGLSEASLSTITEYGDSEEHICDTVGKPVKGVEIRIVDPVTREECPVGTAGEVMIRGFNLMCSYYKLPAELQSVDEKGWLHTGDRGFLDSDGYLHFDGRYKELIIRGGENIMPNEIAAVISQNEDIQDVKVVGVPDEFYGEAVCACVVMKDGVDFREEKMRAFLSGKLSKQKIPAYFMVYDSMPRLSNGKPDMVSIRKDAEKKFTQSN